MARKDLERVVKTRVKPVVDLAMQKAMGITVSELSRDITSKIEKNPLLGFAIDTSVPFKKAKKQFKKQYLLKLLRINYGNVSEVARITNLDRRSIHRIVRAAKINVDKIRQEMAKAYEIKQSAVNEIIEDVLDHYKESIHPTKLEKMYKRVPELSKDILEELPEQPLSLKEAEQEFEREYIRKALEESGFNIVKTADKIGIR
jgi:DNA-binding NtrC family response regulator